MIKVILKRVVQIIPTLFFVVLFTFIVTRIIPGDPATVLIGDDYTAEALDQLRDELGFNDSIQVQFLRYLNDILHGDFGRSYHYRAPALEVIGKRLPNTLLLAVPSLIIAIGVGLLFGVVSGKNQGKFKDYFLTIVSLFGISIPVFWAALMLVMQLGVRWHILPTSGMATISRDGFVSFIKHMVIPCICLAIIPMGTFTRITRSSMIDSLSSESITALNARGIAQKRILWRHALKNALPPVVTVIGIQFAGCFAGAVMTENIFSWPGMGTMITSAIDNRDYSLIQATVLVVAIAFVLINLLTDIAYMLLNPKVALDMMKGRQ